MAIDADEIFLMNENKRLISAELAWHYRVLPGREVDDQLVLYTEQGKIGNPFREELETLLGRGIVLVPKEKEVIEKALASFYIRKNTQDTFEPSSNADSQDKDFVSDLLQEAKFLKSSDIHIETYEQKCRIRLRIDGKLVERKQLQRDEYPSLINRIKILAGLDISERRLPQDGRILYNRGELKFDIRVSILPTMYGEKIVLRILGSSLNDVSIDSLGLSTVDLARFKDAVKRPSGIILISGPTGSGKTTTLYATLKSVNKDSDNILTVEDPIEYTLEGVNQVQVKDDIGLSFSKVLRTFLRQDPDIIMVGEIRDVETANLAIRAALTGHLVLSTIHANSAWGSVARLVDMTIPPFLLSRTLNATIAQRLIRILCKKCKEQQSLADHSFPENFSKKSSLSHHFVAKGCEDCFYTGFKGRKAIYEVIPIDSQASEFIVNSEKNVGSYFNSRGVKTLQDSALELLQQGETTIQEIYPLLLDDQY